MTVENIDLNSTLLIGVGLCALCVVGVLLLFVLQFLGIFTDAVGTVFDLVFGLVGAEPFSCCGCLTVLGALAIVVVLVWFANSVLATCGTPDAVNFCAWFGL